MFAVRTVGGGESQRREAIGQLTVGECGVPELHQDWSESRAFALEANPCLKIRPDVATRRAG